MLHAKAMVCVVAYDMYVECEGNLDSTWKIEKKLSFWEFRDKLGRQLLAYDPRLGHYPGDDKMRCFTAMNKDQRKKKSLEPKMKRSRSSRASETTSNTPIDESGKRKSTGDDEESSDESSEDQ